MKEIIWHGRGGQGAFTASKLLGAAYSLKDNSYAIAFPTFGPERRGAPILAFTKLDSKPIGNRSQVLKADYVVFLDDTLFTENAFNELKDDGKILINTKKTFNNERIITYDADSVALDFLNIPVTNTVMLALLSNISGLISESELNQALSLYMPPKLYKKNEPLVKYVISGEGGHNEANS